MRHYRQILICAFAALLWALPAAAQMHYGDLLMRGNADIGIGYTGDFGNLQTSDHGMSVGGDAALNGSYYLPTFLSFGVEPYYNRSQANSESQSIFDSSGYSGGVSIFSGSHFPGTVNFSQGWDSSGTFGIPGITGLTTRNNFRGFGIGWSALLPGLPSLNVSFSRSSASGSVPGSDEQNNSTGEAVGISSGYRIAGWTLGGGFSHSILDNTSNGFMESGVPETADTSTNSYTFGTGHSLPLLQGAFNLNFTRIDYSSKYEDGVTGKDNGTTDSAYGTLTFKAGKVPFVASAAYTDNLYGSLEQQLLSSGATTTLENSISPESHSLLVTLGASYPILPHTRVSGFVSRQDLYVAGQSYGVTQFGANIHGDFGKRLKGLTATVGVLDSADKQGNTGASLVANVNYNRYVGRWALGGSFDYNESIQTLMAIYQISGMSYSAQARRQLFKGLSWTISGGGGRSVFVQVPGEGSHAEGLSSSLSWRRFGLSGNYSKSNGTAVLTPTGLVPVPLPVVSSNLTLYNGESRGLNLTATPVRSMSLSLGYSKANSSVLSPNSPFGNINTETELYSGVLTYQFRKLWFQAGALQFHQGIGLSSTLPSVVTSYYFGIYRWFKLF